MSAAGGGRGRAESGFTGSGSASLRERGSPPAWLGPLVLAAFFVALFLPLLRARWIFYGEQPRYSHCLLLPVLSALYAWERWDDLRKIARRPSAKGLTLLAVGVLGYVYGRAVSMNFLQHLSMLLTVVGLVWGLCGPALTRASAFPLGYLFLTIPLPKVWDDAVTLPLQRVATIMAEGAFDALGWVVVRQGNVITLPGLKLLVEDQCSGIHSLYALFALGGAWVFFVERPPWLRVFLIVATVPIAVLANSIRVIGTGVLAYKVDTSYATGVSHTTAGMIVFGIGVALLLLADWCLKPDGPPQPAPPSESVGVDRDRT